MAGLLEPFFLSGLLLPLLPRLSFRLLFPLRLRLLWQGRVGGRRTPSRVCLAWSFALLRCHLSNGVIQAAFATAPVAAAQTARGVTSADISTPAGLRLATLWTRYPAVRFTSCKACCVPGHAPPRRSDRLAIRKAKDGRNAASAEQQHMQDNDCEPTFPLFAKKAMTPASSRAGARLDKRLVPLAVAVRARNARHARSRRSGLPMQTSAWAGPARETPPANFDANWGLPPLPPLDASERARPASEPTPGTDTQVTHK